MSWILRACRASDFNFYMNTDEVFRLQISFVNAAIYKYIQYKLSAIL